MKIRKALFALLLITCVLFATGCKQKSAIEQMVEDTAKIKITVDQETVQQVQEGIDSTKGK